MNQLHLISLPTSQSKHEVKNNYMSVNSNPTVYKQNVKTSWLKIVLIYPRLTPVINLYLCISPRIS
jgi:hypothetical protein